MSIINDALKKVEKDKQHSQNKAQPILSNVDKIKRHIESYVLKRRLFLAGAAILCLGGIIFAIRALQSLDGKDIAQSVLSSETVPELSSQGSAFYQRKIDIEIPRRDSDFRLVGILYDEQKPMAIINDRIVEKGALVSGAQVLEIQPNSVTLSCKGKEFTLKVK